MVLVCCRVVLQICNPNEVSATVAVAVAVAVAATVAVAVATTVAATATVATTMCPLLTESSQAP